MAQQTLTAPDQALATPADEAMRHTTILHVQWALAMACAYLVLFGQESGDPQGLGPLVVVGFLATNLIVGRLRPALASAPLFGIALAAIDAALITTSLYVAGQLSIELVLLCLGILILAIAGLRIGPIALATLALTAAYLAIVWFTGDHTLWRSSVLLRVPLLFTAAIVYAWLVELGSVNAPPGEHASEEPEGLRDEVGTQSQALERAQAALRSGSLAEADAALRQVAEQNQVMRMQLHR
jgi:hypothetical protein